MKVVSGQLSVVSKQIIFLALSAMLFALCTSAEAQQPQQIPRVVYLSTASSAPIAARYEAFRQGLRELGYAEGKNIFVEWRHAEGKLDRLPEIVAGLVRLSVSVIVTSGSVTTRAVKRAANTIPVVMTQAGKSRQGDQMKTNQWALRKESRRPDRVLTHKPVYRNQAFADGINGEEKTFESDGPEQGWTFRRNEAWSRDFVAIQSQACFGDGPDISLPARDHDPLGAGGFQVKLFGQRSGNHGECRAGVHKKLNFFYMARRTSQVGLYVEQSHIKSLKSKAIVAQPTNNATTPIFDIKRTINLKAAKRIGLMIPPNVLARADKVIVRREG